MPLGAAMPSLRGGVSPLTVIVSGMSHQTGIGDGIHDWTISADGAGAGMVPPTDSYLLAFAVGDPSASITNMIMDNPAGYGSAAPWVLHSYKDGNSDFLVAGKKITNAANEPSSHRLGLMQSGGSLSVNVAFAVVAQATIDSMSLVLNTTTAPSRVAPETPSLLMAGAYGITGTVSTPAGMTALRGNENNPQLQHAYEIVSSGTTGARSFGSPSSQRGAYSAILIAD